MFWINAQLHSRFARYECRQSSFAAVLYIRHNIAALLQFYITRAVIFCQILVDLLYKVTKISSTVSINISKFSLISPLRFHNCASHFILCCLAFWIHYRAYSQSFPFYPCTKKGDGCCRGLTGWSTGYRLETWFTESRLQKLRKSMQNNICAKSCECGKETQWQSTNWERWRCVSQI